MLKLCDTVNFFIEKFLLITQKTSYGFWRGYVCKWILSGLKGTFCSLCSFCMGMFEVFSVR